MKFFNFKFVPEFMPNPSFWALVSGFAKFGEASVFKSSLLDFTVFSYINPLSVLSKYYLSSYLRIETKNAWREREKWA